jgi:hypothetical protein
MFILFTNLFLARPFRLENTLECYNLRGGQGGSTEVNFPIFSKNLLNLILLFNILTIFSKKKWKPNFKCFFQYFLLKICFGKFQFIFNNISISLIFLFDPASSVRQKSIPGSAGILSHGSPGPTGILPTGHRSTGIKGTCRYSVVKTLRMS